jgi:hypothetical protein
MKLFLIGIKGSSRMTENYTIEKEVES